MMMMTNVIPVGSELSSKSQTPLIPNSQVEKINKPTRINHSNHKGSTSQWGLLALRREKKDFKTIHLLEIVRSLPLIHVVHVWRQMGEADNN